MRAFLVMLMFTLLPLQFSAAMAAECCGHIAVAQESPVQHHQPAHTSAGSGMEELATNGLDFDLDCGTCHANCAAALTATSATKAVPVGIERAEHLVERFLLPWIERPYRPRWPNPSGSGLNAYA